MINQTTSGKRVRFRSNPRKDEFIRVYRERVDNYFRDNNMSPYANTEMIVKTIIAFLFWGGSYALLMSNILSPYPVLLILAFTMLGYANIFIAFNIMHDACHNAYSANRKVNKILGYTMNFIGGNRYLFTKMHNAHHAYVNILGIDVTLETHGLFRFTPDEPYKPFHKYQHIYTPILYALAHLHWVTVKDFKWFFVEKHIGNRKNIKHPFKEYVILFISKAIYYALIFVFPFIFIEAHWALIVLGILSIHFLPSLTFALMFQVTHVYEGTTYPKPDDDGNIENNYALHVLETTADFLPHSRIGSWLMGGINLHVVHHIFPGICHVHYPALTKILIQTCEDFGLEYQYNKSFNTALKKHIAILKHLAQPDATVPRVGKSAQFV